jgi:hypothetical protein
LIDHIHAVQARHGVVDDQKLGCFRADLRKPLQAPRGFAYRIAEGLEAIDDEPPHAIIVFDHEHMLLPVCLAAWRTHCRNAVVVAPTIDGDEHKANNCGDQFIVTAPIPFNGRNKPF